MAVAAHLVRDIVCIRQDAPAVDDKAATRSMPLPPHLPRLGKVRLGGPRKDLDDRGESCLEGGSRRRSGKNVDWMVGKNGSKRSLHHLLAIGSI